MPIINIRDRSDASAVLVLLREANSVSSIGDTPPALSYAAPIPRERLRTSSLSPFKGSMWFRC